MRGGDPATSAGCRELDTGTDPSSTPERLSGPLQSGSNPVQLSSVSRVLLLLLTTVALGACGDGQSGLGPPEGLTISLSPTTLTMAPGASVAIEATVLDNTGRVISGAVIAWVSSDESVVVVGVRGTAQALEVGQATITASVESDSTPNSASTIIEVVQEPL